jgi:hypothetical protein
MVDETLLLSNLGTALIAAGGAGGIVAWRKLRPETEAIAVETLGAVIRSLRDELDRKQDEVSDMRVAHLAEMERKQAEITDLRHRVEGLALDLAKVVSDPPDHLA